MLMEHLTYTDSGPSQWGEALYRYCTFDGLDNAGLNFTGIMQASTFTRSSFYWGLFNCALLDGVRFVDCTFPGTSFRGVRFMECTFENCRFVLDNMGGDCTIEGSILAACVFDGCVWVTRPEGKRDITNSQFLGCTFRNCRGFDGLG
jgi:uncharacterized protein YjbI with pentapeptide repeats